MIPSFLKTFPQKADRKGNETEWSVKMGNTEATWKGAQGDPANYVLRILGKGPDGKGPVEMDVRIRAVQDVDLDEFFRGKECTAFWLPEFDTHASASILSYCANRTGRHPEPEDRPENPPFPAWEGVWGDCNTPTIGSWFQKEFFSASRSDLAARGVSLHKQPPGYDPESPDGFHAGAENAGNLRRIRPDYYRHKALTMEAHDVARLLQCKLTYGRMGSPVHPAFDETVHVSKERLEPDDDAVVVIGIDVDFHGAATFGQRGMFGSWKVFAEIVAADSQDGEMDAIEFGDAIKATLKQRFPRCKKAIIVMDPAGKSRSTTNRRISWASELQVRTGITVVPAATNDPGMRRTALARPLKRRNGILIDPSCTWLNTALNGGFHYPKKGNTTSRSAKKNEYSSIGEAAEYMVMGGEGVEDRAGLIPHMGLSDPAVSNVVEVVFD